jgi:hypothetical protein
MAIKGIIVCEGEFHDVVEKPNEEVMEAYAEGLTDGANLYGAGGCSLYTEGDLEWLDPESEDDAKVIEMINKHLKGAT